MDNFRLWMDKSGQLDGSKLSGHESLLLQSTAKRFLEAGVDIEFIRPFLN
jgi:hypothetical protein